MSYFLTQVMYINILYRPIHLLTITIVNFYHVTKPCTTENQPMLEEMVYLRYNTIESFPML